MVLAELGRDVEPGRAVTAAQQVLHRPADVPVGRPSILIAGVSRRDAPLIRSTSHAESIGELCESWRIACW